MERTGERQSERQESILSLSLSVGIVVGKGNYLQIQSIAKSYDLLAGVVWVANKSYNFCNALYENKMM